MAAITAPRQHSMHPSFSFGPEQRDDVEQAYNQTAEEDLISQQELYPAQSSPKLGHAPLPNPPFVFPARSSPSLSPNLTHANARRPISAYDLQEDVAIVGDEKQKRNRRSLPPPLPSFSFNSTTSPSVEAREATLPHSPSSPTSSRAIPARSGGHRRGGSEFIGGDGTTGAGMGLMSTSPTKGVEFLPNTAVTSPLSPTTGRRGHAHRRSAAMSCHDLTMILKPSHPNGLPRGGSAPTTPLEAEHHRLPFPESLNSTTQSGVASSSSLVPQNDFGHADQSGDSPPLRITNRGRVGFSDTLEFIPRPLSLVSSDTSSTMTVRQGHSVSGSLSSIVSARTSSPSAMDQHRLGQTQSYSPSHKVTNARPRTAGPILGNSSGSPRFDEQIQALTRPSSMSSATKTSPTFADSPIAPRLPPRNYLTFGHDSGSTPSTPSRSRPVSAGSYGITGSMGNTNIPADRPTSNDHVSMDPLVVASRTPSLTRKSSKKQKKVKSWAGSILSRKSRLRSQKKNGLSRRSPTPPLRSYNTSIEAIIPPDPDDNESINAETILPPARPDIATDFASWKPRQIALQDDDSMSPIIDLDAALGPFNTPSGHDPAWDASQKVSAVTKRRMHSAAGMGGFMGPGMHYHRRAESAPEFENPRFGLHRLGSSSTMADVFEVDEEDDEWEEMKAASPNSSQSKLDREEEPGMGITVVDADNMHDDKPMDWTLGKDSTPRGLKRKNSELSESGKRQVSSSTNSERSAKSLKDEPIFEEEPAVPADAANHLTTPTSESDANTSESTVVYPLQSHTPYNLIPIESRDVSLPPPYLTPTSFQSASYSPLPSPRSPASYSPQRISTAPSSLNDERSFQSLLLGEPGPEIRMSVDDVPSLTSSNSTTTRESMYNPVFSNPQLRDGQRSASLCSASNTRKRSSIASLSRILGSSHGEKSKLSIEERPPTAPEKSDKNSKGKRISRLMQFWKPKDASP